MYNEALEHFKLAKPFVKAGYFETPQYREIYTDLKRIIMMGGIVSLTGMVGSGKTTMLQRIKHELDQEKKITTAQCLTTDKRKLSINNIILALYYDLSPKNSKASISIPNQNESKERLLLDLIIKRKSSVVLFIDEAHDIHGQTLVALKRIIEIAPISGYHLSVVLAGHPKLRNSLSKGAMEEIGARIEMFEIDTGFLQNREKYIDWLVKDCLADKKVKLNDVISPDAITLITNHLVTPLQISRIMTDAVMQAYKIGENIISADLISSLLKADLNNIDAVLARNGYQQINAVAELLGATQKEAKDFLSGKLSGNKRQEYLNILNGIGLNFEKTV
jgi:type II secretory pathway predicted ATPase ExeA